MRKKMQKLFVSADFLLGLSVFGLITSCVMAVR